MMTWSKAFWLAATLLALGAFASLATNAPTRIPDIPDELAVERIRPESIRAHLEFLADDLLEGRATGSRGHKLAVNYIRAQCELAGLRGAAGGGSWFQKVPLLRASVDEQQTHFKLKTKDSARTLVYGTDFSVLLIPHTLEVTTWGAVRAGDRLNIEVDQMARYAARLAEARAEG